jgi:hypothetical protein
LILGRLLAELMTGETPVTDPSPYKEVRFAADSPVEGAVTSELVSEEAEFPVIQGIYRDFRRFGP